MKIYKIHLIRHGLTDANTQGRYIGRTDIPLSVEGIHELKEFQEKFEYPTVQKVYTSPLTRCIQTANILFPDRWQQIVDDFREYDFGDFDGKSLAQLKLDPRFLSFIEDDIDPKEFGGEDNEDFAKRCDQALMTVFEDMMKNQITECAVITHGGLISHLLSAHGIPQRSAADWGCGCGCGYTLYATTQMWMRDHKMEVFSYVPITREDTVYHRSYEILDVPKQNKE